MTPPPTTIVLAQVVRKTDIGPYLLWIGVFLVLVIGAGLAILAYRKVMLSSHAADSHTGILDGLRRMRDSGQMTQAEYDSARRAIAAKVRVRQPAHAAATRPSGGTAATEGDRTARPGFDLTGAPLPKADDPEGRGGGV
ncbi:MAG: hypothetical protein IT437_10570 [Phycisphaerales bacterium]|nr:hypothetical protein [Phycisphaerales bacterium]